MPQTAPGPAAKGGVASYANRGYVDQAGGGAGGNFLPLTGGTLQATTGSTLLTMLSSGGFGGSSTIQVTAGGSSNFFLNSASAANFSMMKAPGSTATITCMSTIGGSRWAMTLGNGTAESGGNAGSDFILNTFTDAGLALGTPLSIARATGICTFSAPINAPNIIPDAPNDGQMYVRQSGAWVAVTIP
ncbi:MAG TPA: hypothetical protein VK890_01255 [Bacteroidia bacterium]|jgi:hypothetical protein|nr:hypothetical protein [Bacteroidia bacterium]